MNFLLKAATIIDPQSSFHNKTVDILIKDGIIRSIGSLIEKTEDTTEINLKNLHISQGWFDSSISFGEPGYEERETISQGLDVAGKSGFTTIALNPDTNPIIDNSTAIGFVKNKALGHPVTVHPIGALTIGSKGIDLAELYDMKKGGAIAFGDFKKSTPNPNLMKLALQYAQNFDGLVLSYPQDNDIAGKGMVNEEEQATLLGLKGIPALAEELQVSRDLFLLQYTGGKLHIPTISTAKSVALIRDAKEKGLHVSCSVAIHNTVLTDEELKEFDTSFKLHPPLRTQTDLDAILEGINDGTIDMLTSDHIPMDIEHKKVEFDNAKYGSIGLESAFGVLNNYLGTSKTIDVLTQGKKIFGIPNTPIEEGAIADISLFNPEGTQTFSEEAILSSSKNSAFINKDTKGHVYGIIANGILLEK
ncbi:dihydroorotase family protein [Aquimarina hainanensis]|uniref:Dihydroorotase family protein n=1 Tax=Aquimarina hainanensis TaxID=1578017 RepID=A0ABW5NG00_9FLAO|nr:dihydroorotase [Aquimarina sp. TRL1]QKX06388.1 dihydroorotase [Aquimarina sp. TRL1]